MITMFRPAELKTADSIKEEIIVSSTPTPTPKPNGTGFRPAALQTANSGSIEEKIVVSSTPTPTPKPVPTSPIPEDLKTPGGSAYPDDLTHDELVTALKQKKAAKGILKAYINDINHLIDELKKEGRGNGFCAGLGIVLWCYYQKGKLNDFIDDFMRFDAIGKDFSKSDINIIQILKLVIEMQRFQRDKSKGEHFAKNIGRMIHEHFSLGIEKKSAEPEIIECTSATFKDRLEQMEIGALELICNLNTLFKHAVHIIRMSDDDFMFYDANYKTIYRPVKFKLSESDEIFNTLLITGLYDNFNVTVKNRHKYWIEFNTLHRRPDLDSVMEHIVLSHKTPIKQSPAVKKTVVSAIQKKPGTI